MAEQVIPPARMDLAAAPALHAELLARAGADVTVEMSGVTQIGALCAQMLIAGARAARDGGHALTLSGVNDRVLGQMAAMGLTPEAIMEGR
jgi:chemotaxis protein CheX